MNWNRYMFLHSFFFHIFVAILILRSEIALPWLLQQVMIDQTKIKSSSVSKWLYARVSQWVQYSLQFCINWKLRTSDNSKAIEFNRILTIPIIIFHSFKRIYSIIIAVALDVSFQIYTEYSHHHLSIVQVSSTYLIDLNWSTVYYQKNFCPVTYKYW